MLTTAAIFVYLYRFFLVRVHPRQDGPRQDGPRQDGPRQDGLRQSVPAPSWLCAKMSRAKSAAPKCPRPENSEEDVTKNPFLAILSPETAATVCKNAFPIIICRLTTQNDSEFVRLIGLDRKCFAVGPRSPMQLCVLIAIGVI
ncbi:hypothetical protein Zmor_014546 [Zophobas morio]|uniref:Uncharacterized protein n=1 Tax=Zophobas morio TaxID=2755281 RepID=A0AA38IHY0_9CUCU|nr:hypothetical protein Zmor_014546 [Zophobas morio]